MCNVSLQSSHKMVTVLPANQTASTISHRPMRAQPTGNDSIEAGGLHALLGLAISLFVPFLGLVGQGSAPLRWRPARA